MAKEKTPKAPPKSHHEILLEEFERERKEGFHYGVSAGEDVIAFPEKISTGSLWFDIILEGGFRAGWSRFSGEPENGKTAQGLAWGAQWQKHFKDDAFVMAFNAEGRMTAELLRRSGIDTDPRYFLRVDSNNGDYIINKINKLCTHNPFGKRYFFLLDSSDALIRAHDMDKTAEQSEKIGGSATLLSFAGKRLSLPVSKYGHHLYITSQLRDSMNSPMGGRKESGGNAPKFYSSLSGRMRKLFVKGREDGFIYSDSSKTKAIGRKTLIELYKSPNEKSSEEVILHVKNGHIGGIWREYEVLALSEVWNLITRSGSWFAPSELFAEELIQAGFEPFSTQGELATVLFLEQNPKLTQYIEERLRSTLISS